MKATEAPRTLRDRLVQGFSKKQGGSGEKDFQKPGGAGVSLTEHWATPEQTLNSFKLNVSEIKPQKQGDNY